MDRIVIGIVGGGQLGRMLAEAARKLGFETVVLDPTPDSPAGQVADKQIVGDFTDAVMIRKLGAESDYVTFEIELANNEALEALITEGKLVHPSPATLAIIKDKYEQKKFLQSHGIPTAEFREVKTREDAVAVGIECGYPYVLKAKRDSYDGRGNATVESEVGIDAAFEKLKGRDLYAEKWVPFSKELAIIAVRGKGGEVVTYPVVETVHRDHILDTTLAPATIPLACNLQAEGLARAVMEHLQGQGAFGIEMFLVEEQIFVNEIAPRVHNSGHYTIEACETSQFENHIRAVTGMPLGSTAMKVPAAVTINILGNRTGTADPKGVDEAEKILGVKVHMYGKKETKPARKMGHVTAVAATLDKASENAKSARASITI